MLWQIRQTLPGILLVGLFGTVGCATPLQPGTWFAKPPSLVATTVPTADSKPEPLAKLDSDKTYTLYLEYGDNLAKDGKYAEAIQQYEKARALRPKAPETARKLALAHDKAGEFSKAMTEYRKALAAAPRDAALLNDIGYCAYQQERYTEAEGHFRKAVEIQPDYQRAWVNLGLALGQQGKYAESLAAFQRVISPAESHCNLAFVYASQGKVDLAKGEYRRALELEPGMKAARSRLAALDRMEKEPESTPPAPLRFDRDLKHAVAVVPAEPAPLPAPVPPAPNTAVQLSAPVKAVRVELPSAMIGPPEPLR